MDLKIFSVFDLKASAYLEPFFTNNAATALRSFSQACQQEDHQFNRHPTDYVLYQIGTWNQVEGVIVPEEHNIALGKAIDFIQKDLEVVNRGA